MIDNEPFMIDRRIILEAKTLVNAGYSVILVTAADGIKPYYENQFGIDIYRVPDLLHTYYPLFERKDINQIVDWINVTDSLTLERTIAEKYSGRSQFMRDFMLLFSFPPLMAAAMRSKFPFIKKIMGFLFEPMIYALMGRWGFLKPYFRVFFNRVGMKIGYVSSKKADENFEQAVLNLSDTIKPLIVHVHDLPNLALGVKIAKKHLSYLIYDAHELYCLQYFENESRASALASLERQWIDNVDATIVVNQQCKEFMEKSYPSQKDIVIISNATEVPQQFDATVKQRKWHERFNLHHSVKIMVFQGGINPVRNVDELVHALTYLPDNIHLGFITYRKDVLYYKKLTDHLGISDRVHYVLELPWGDVIDWLASADAGVMPYQANNYNAKISSPNKLYEFVMAGLPIMASTALVNVKHAIETYQLGVCHLLTDVDSYVCLINEMMDEKKGGPERFRSAVIMASEFFSWHHEEPKLLNLYHRLFVVSDNEVLSPDKLGELNEADEPQCVE
jgi:hypothetical protein